MFYEQKQFFTLTLLQGPIILEFSNGGNGQQFKRGEVYSKVQQFAGNEKKNKASLEKEAGSNACSTLKKLILFL